MELTTSLIATSFTGRPVTITNIIDSIRPEQVPANFTFFVILTIQGDSQADYGRSVKINLSITDEDANEIWRTRGPFKALIPEPTIGTLPTVTIPAQITVPIANYGCYTVGVEIDDRLVRRLQLKFLPR